MPLMTCIDYKGRRLIASSVLPIGSNTLIYGSADGANTVRAPHRIMHRSLLFR